MSVLSEFVAAPEAEAFPTPPKLGRIPADDSRSHLRQFSMPTPRTTSTYRMWLSPAWGPWPSVLDQGSTPQCCAYAGTKFLLSHRIVNRPHVPPAELYRSAQQMDEWEGEGYDGTSVNGTMKALRALGLISGWTWGFERGAVVRHLLEVGPVVMGTDWTDSMFDVDASGYIWPNDAPIGGHAYLLLGVNMRRANPDGSQGAVRMLNSWGAGWGQSGRAWISLNALDQLLEGLEWPGGHRWAGEAAAPIEVQLPR